MNKLLLIITSFFFITLFSCSENQNNLDFEVTIESPRNSDTLEFDIDLSDAVTKGIKIPQNSNKDISFKFKIKNCSGKKQKFFYKIYYQNESYKYKEQLKYNRYNIKSSENFYGTWIKHNTDFKKTKPINDDASITVNETITIVGNPRNEKKYFGKKTINPLIIAQKIPETCEEIKNSQEWFANVKGKAKQNNIPLEEQIYLDAKWYLQNQNDSIEENNRWKRNPRMGVYSFLLVVVPEMTIKRIPKHIRNIELKDKKTRVFINPFYYFLHSKRTTHGIYKAKLPRHIKVSAKMNIKNGVFIDPLNLQKNTSLADTIDKIGYGNAIYKQAHFTPFSHNINKENKINNIPIAYDVTGNNYTQEMYKNAKSKTLDKNRINDFVQFSEKPATTINIVGDSSILLKNVGQENSGKLMKENVGLQTRIGVTYGKFRAKIQFPEIISNDFVWNGLTCSFGLISQKGKWNNRNICNKGYLIKSLSNNKIENREKTTDYSEIDIEIIKTSKDWPQKFYTDKNKKPIDDALNNNIILSCNNWDMACQNVSQYVTEVKQIKHKQQPYELHRLDKTNQILSSKYETPQSKTLGKPMYFEIEWNPKEIIYKIGKTQKQMQVIGYMNSKHTKIPNNQMVAFINQKFIDELKLPTTPFKQNDIPFPKKDIKGYIYEIIIE